MNLLKIETYVEKDINVVVECPKGTVHKYEYNPKGYMEIVRDLKKRYKYPYNYGFIPKTLAGDGDALDAIVFSDEPICSGTVVRCKVIGIIETMDEGFPDNKVLCVPYYIKTGKINLKKVLHYLRHYKHPDQDGTFIGSVYSEPVAREIIDRCVRRYNGENIYD